MKIYASISGLTSEYEFKGSLHDIKYVHILLQANAGINFLKIQTGIGEDASSKAILWKVFPEHGLENWQVGQVNVQRSKDYKIVFSAQRNNLAIGYVAIDDFEFNYVDEPCSLEPPAATPPTTTTTTTTTTTPIESMNCDFQDKNLCGWTIDDNTNATGRFHFERKNGDEILIIAGLPDKDHTGSRARKHFSNLAITAVLDVLMSFSHKVIHKMTKCDSVMVHFNTNMKQTTK